MNLFDESEIETRAVDMSPGAQNAREAAELAAEMLTWGEWSGADLDLINRAKAGDMLGDEAEILRDMHEQRQRERRLRR
jgi:hypothetical protein